MAENSEIITISKNKTNLELESLPSQEVEKIPLLPRSAWNSQLSYLKVLLKAKQVLDKS
ncbi:hypothetical protein [Nostoc sp.]|uniref:hypothetical protein n=1 Tax=Nostoc sp. TaxID=1180 RepID=UPI002FFB9E20